VFQAYALSIIIDIIRGLDYYKKHEKMYTQNLRKTPSFKLISKMSKSKLLDVGCGIGYLSKLKLSSRLYK
jgi:2-polyprenyl-3-methyl-5-hydroxy-6-metoxy-1,4-benzoquinol methylase